MHSTMAAPELSIQFRRVLGGGISWGDREDGDGTDLELDHFGAESARYWVVSIAKSLNW